MSIHPSLEELWNSIPPSSGAAFDKEHLENLPEQARLYLEHSIAPAYPLASAVRLKMHGEIKLKGWCPFSAEQVIHWPRGMIWNASVRMHGIPIRGGDRFLDGEGTMRWKAMGLIPVVNASGTDISRSAAGRVNIEAIWLPSVFCGRDVSWSSTGERHVKATFVAHTESAAIDLLLEERGALKSAAMNRWGNPAGARFEYIPFGCIVEKEASFGGYTIPAQLRVGWYFGTPRFETEGEFFRVTIDSAEYR